MNPSHERVLRYMTYAHLPENLQHISQPLCDIAHELATAMAASLDPAEVTLGLRKLLEAKDCFVRAAVGMPQ